MIFYTLKCFPSFIFTEIQEMENDRPKCKEKYGWVLITIPIYYTTIYNMYLKLCVTSWLVIQSLVIFGSVR